MGNLEEVSNSSVSAVLEIVESFRAKNRVLEDEIQKLRPLARLAELLAVMEGTNHRQHDELIEADRKYEDLNHKYMALLDDYGNNLSLKISVDVAQQRGTETGVS